MSGLVKFYLSNKTNLNGLVFRWNRNGVLFISFYMNLDMNFLAKNRGLV